MFLLGPQINAHLAATGSEPDWAEQAKAIWMYVVRPIAVGGMLVGAATTLFKMRNNLAKGMKRAIKDLKASAGARAATSRLDRDMNMRVVFGGLAVAFLLMIAVYFWFSGNIMAAVIAAIVMAITGFFFAAVSGNLVGLIGSSNNPISGLTISTLLIAALLMVAIGAQGMSGVAAVLGVASVVCISSAVAGEMLQDLKVGHLLGGTPAKMQWGDILGIVIAGSVMYFPLLILQRANINTGGIGFGSPELPAPQAGLMAALAQGVVGGEMAWPLIIVGMLMGLGFVLLKVRSPMLVSVGMYLPLENDIRHLLRGHYPLAVRQDRRQTQTECRPAHADRQRRRAGGFRSYRRRSPHGPGDCHLRLLRQQEGHPRCRYRQRGPLDCALRSGGPGDLHDCPAVAASRRPRRAPAAQRRHVRSREKTIWVNSPHFQAISSLWRSAHVQPDCFA